MNCVVLKVYMCMIFLQTTCSYLQETQHNNQIFKVQDEIKTINPRIEKTPRIPKNVYVNQATEHNQIKNGAGPANNFQTLKHCLFKETSKKLEKTLRKIIQKNEKQIFDQLQPARTGINPEKQNNNRQTLQKQNLETLLQPNTNYVQKTNRKTRQSLSNHEAVHDWSKCALKSELQEHALLESAHITAITTEVEKLQQLVRLLQDQQYILNILNNFDQKPKSDDFENQQKMLRRMLQLMKTNYPSQKNWNTDFAPEGKSSSRNLITAEKPKVQTPFPPLIHNEQLAENRDNITVLAQEIQQLKHLIVNKTIQEVRNKNEEEKLERELKIQKKALEELKSRVEQFKTNEGKASPRMSHAEEENQMEIIQDELTALQENIQEIMSKKKQNQEESSIDIVGSTLPLPIFNLHHHNSSLLEKLTGKPLLHRSNHRTSSRKSDPENDDSELEKLLNLLDEDKSKHKSTRHPHISQLETKKNNNVLKPNQKIMKSALNIPSPITRANDDELVENLQRLLEGSDFNAEAEVKDGLLDLNEKTDPDLENRLTNLEARMEMLKKIQGLEKRVKKLHDSDQLESKTSDDDESVKTQLKQLMREMKQLNKNQIEAKDLNDDENLQQELKNLQTEINNLKPSSDTKFEGKNVELGVMLNKLLGHSGSVSVRPVASVGHHVHLTPVEKQLIIQKLVEIKRRNQHSNSYGLSGSHQGFSSGDHGLYGYGTSGLYGGVNAPYGAGISSYDPGAGYGSKQYSSLAYGDGEETYGGGQYATAGGYPTYGSGKYAPGGGSGQYSASSGKYGSAGMLYNLLDGQYGSGSSHYGSVADSGAGYGSGAVPTALYGSSGGGLYGSGGTLYGSGNKLFRNGGLYGPGGVSYGHANVPYSSANGLYDQYGSSSFLYGSPKPGSNLYGASGAAYGLGGSLYGPGGNPYEYNSPYEPGIKQYGSGSNPYNVYGSHQPSGSYGSGSAQKYPSNQYNTRQELYGNTGGKQYGSSSGAYGGGPSQYLSKGGSTADATTQYSGGLQYGNKPGPYGAASGAYINQYGLSDKSGSSGGYSEGNSLAYSAAHIPTSYNQDNGNSNANPDAQLYKPVPSKDSYGQFFPGDHANGYQKADGSSYKTAAGVDASNSGQSYANAQQNPSNGSPYAQQKVTELNTQIYGLENVIKNLNQPEYIQKPEDQAVKQELDQKIDSLKHMVNYLSKDLPYSDTSSYAASNSAKLAPSSYEPDSSGGAGVQKYDSGNTYGVSDSLSVPSTDQQYAQTSSKRRKREENKSTSNTSAMGDFLQQLNDVIDVVNYFTQNWPRANQTEEEINNQNQIKRQTRKATNDEEPQDKPVGLFNQLRKVAGVVNNLVLEMSKNNFTCSGSKNCSTTIDDVLKFSAQKLKESIPNVRSKRQVQKTDEDDGTEDVWNNMSSILSRLAADDSKEETESNEESIQNQNVNKKISTKPNLQENSHDYLQKRLEELKKQLDIKLHSNSNHQLLLHNQRSPLNRHQAPINLHSSRTQNSRASYYGQPYYQQQSYYPQPISYQQQPYYPQVYYYEKPGKDKDKDKFEKTKIKIKSKKVEIFDKIFTKILDKILDKIEVAVPKIIHKLLNVGFDGLFKLDVEDDYNDGYAQNGYGVNGYGPNGYAVTKKSKKVGLFSLLPMLLVKHFTEVGQFIKKLKRNNFVKTFLVPGLVTAGTAGMVVFLVWWLTEDNDAHYGYNKYGYNGGSNGYSSGYGGGGGYGNSNGYGNSYGNGNNYAYGNSYGNSYRNSLDNIDNENSRRNIGNSYYSQRNNYLANFVRRDNTFANSNEQNGFPNNGNIKLVPDNTVRSINSNFNSPKNFNSYDKRYRTDDQYRTDDR